MTINYTYNKPDNYILTRVTNTASVEQVKQYIKSIISDPKITQPFYEVVDFTEIKNYDFGYFQSEAIIALLIKLKNSKPYLGSCLVVSNDVSKGMSNIFRVIGEEKKIDIRIFNSITESVDYINQVTSDH